MSGSSACLVLRTSLYIYGGEEKGEYERDSRRDEREKLSRKNVEKDGEDEEEGKETSFEWQRRISALVAILPS